MLYRILNREEQIERFLTSMGPVSQWHLRRLRDFQAALLMLLGGEMYEALALQFSFCDGIPHATCGYPQVRLDISIASAKIPTRGTWFLSNGERQVRCAHHELYVTTKDLLQQVVRKTPVIQWG